MDPNFQQKNGAYSALAQPVNDYAVTPVGNEPKHDPFASSSGSRGSKWSPRNWSKIAWIGVAIGVIIVIVAVVVGAVVGTEQANKYPDYSYLNYSLADSYQGSNFFHEFQYFNADDPAEGVVVYDNPIDAVNRNLTFASDSSAIMRINWTSPTQKEPLHSARIYSLKTYNDGLFLFDIKHAPYGCATWPAVWLSNPWNWPTDGEIDVIEAVNQGTSGNQMTLHTTSGCTMKAKRKQTGQQLNANCLNSTDSNAGCGVKGAPSTYGPAFNAAGGGVYALELRSAGIRIWFFPRASIPADVSAAISSPANGTAAARAAGHPDPTTWGEALADFPSTHCDIGSHFRNQSLIANIDMCGQWAGTTATYTTQDQCPGTSCAAYVKANPDAFGDAFWEFGAWKVFQADGA